MTSGQSLHKMISRLHFSKSAMVSFQIWGIIVIELRKQPAEEVRFTVTSRRFGSETKRVGKGIVIAAPWHIGTKAQPEWLISFEAEERRLPTACVWAAPVEHLGRAAPCKTGGCEALVPTFSLCRETVHTKGKGSTADSAWGYLVLGSLSLNKVRETFAKHKCILLQTKRIDER